MAVTDVTAIFSSTSCKFINKYYQLVSAGNAMLKNDDSLRLQLLRFPLIVGVVFIHAYTLGADPSTAIIGASHANEFVQTLISQELARCAVPLFFLISGYLFFYGTTWSTEKYKSKIQSRISTLLIPFLFWNILVLLLFAAAQSHPKTALFFSGQMTLISDYRISDYFIAIFGIVHYPASYQFWFIRDLMVLALLAPLIYQLLTKVPAIFLATLLTLWILRFGGDASKSALFFILGAYVGIKQYSLFLLDKQAKWMFPLYIAMAIVNSIYPETCFYPYVHKIGIMLGLPSFLYLTKILSRSTALKTALVSMGKASFFVFATHEPLLTVIRKISYKMLQPQHDAEILTIYFLSVVVTVACCSALFFLLNRIVPRFTRMIAGGR
ncbi:acyltransferase family protein [Janthinobacterium sp. GB1R12]|uniref:acyltransferase family protein n=1 Tax=Janthinobacterium sp. GB1R12 TaxID=3424190 RepID=UPI003F2396A6